MNKDMMVRNVGKCDAISGNISMGSDPIDFAIDFDWTDNHWGRLRRWMTSAIMTLLLTLFATPSPVQAAVELVPPISGSTTWINNYSESFPSAEAACLGLRDPYTYLLFFTSDKYAFMGFVTNLAYPTVWQDCLWTYLPTGGSFRGGSVRPVTDAVCPIPTVNPDIKYVYRITTGKCERTVPDKLSIELEEISTVEPSKTRSIKATVKGPDGPQGGVAVTVILDVDATSGGHDHGESFDVRPRGGLSGATVCPSTAPPRSVCATGATSNTAPNVGVAMFTFTAPAPAGTHTFTATCKECTNTASASVDVKVEGLVPIPDSIFYKLIEADGKTVIGSTDNHKDKGNHFLTPEAASVLWRMAASYNIEDKYWQYRKQKKGGLTYEPSFLHLNDASLHWGGMFDISGKWKPAHKGHRRGVVIDVRANKKPGKIPLASFDKFEKMALAYKATAKIHCKDDGQDRQPPLCTGNDGSEDSSRHFHIQLLGVDK